MICTHKFYTARNQRIAAFAEPVEGKLRIVMFICSARDNFIKALARSAYDIWNNSGQPSGAQGFSVRSFTLHPTVILVDLTGDSRTQFLELMEQNYYRKGISIHSYVQPILYKAGKTDVGKKLSVKHETVIYIGKARRERSKREL